MKELFNARIKSVTRKTANVVELIVHAPLASKHFKPGQFYRLQNFETFAPRIDHTLLQMEPLALVAANHNKTQGTLTFLVTENTAAAKLCAALKPDELISLMGPTGVRTKIPSEHETVLIIGNTASFGFLRSYGTEMRAAGNRVIYLGQFNHSDEIYCQTKCEATADTIIWLTSQDKMISKRQQDIAVSGENVIDVLIQHAGEISLVDVDRIFIVGDTDLLRSFQAARKTLLKDYLIKNPKVFGSVYGNMQCMLKGVCAQCLQWQIDPETGQRTKAVFACSWQDQPLEIIDIDHIDARQSQNRLLESLSVLWVDHVFRKYNVERV